MRIDLRLVLMPWPIEYEFMQYALAAGLIVGATAPLVGVFLVQKRLSLMGDGIGHVAFAGVAVGLLLDIWPVWAALAVAVGGALLIEWLRSRREATGDLALSLILYEGLAGGIVLVGKADAGNESVVPYLFGSLLTVDAGELGLLLGMGLTIGIVLLITGRALLATVIDEESARVAGIPVGLCNNLLAVLTAVTVVAAMRAVGILLVAALMVLPVASSRLVARSFRGIVIVSSAIGIGSVVLGLVAARAWDLAPGGAIVLTAGVFFLGAAAAGRRLQRAT
ncbi:MAG: metal ABC transporter permease [Actinobacteria bacterium]|nr:metal ABC transporter permease [Actinomycetota bacterium]